MRPDAPEVAVFLPAALLAVTRTRKRRPTSWAAARYVGCVARRMLLQAPPRALQRSHWYRYVFGGPLQVPLLVVSRPLTRARPEMCGAFFRCGTLTITALCFETACPVPAAFVAVTTTSNVWPASPPSRK